MRVGSWVLLLLVAGLVGGCATDSREGAEEATSAAAVPVPERDLTLQAPAVPPVEIASPVELARPASPAREHLPVSSPLPLRSKPERAPAEESLDSAGTANAEIVRRALGDVAAEAAPVLAEASPVGRPAEPADEVGGGAGRELAPGRTVTLIPVSSGPSIEAGDDEAWLPSERHRGVVRGGGHCPRPRGGVRGTGIAGRFPVALPVRRLR